MSAKLYGPEDTWPTHDKPWWASALRLAQAAGWTLQHIDAKHTFGYVRCPTGEHTAKVDCTAKAGEAFAKDCERAARECRHGTPVGPGSKVAERLQAAETLLATAERLVRTAEADLVLAEARVEALARMDRLAVLLDTAEATVAEATDLDIEQEAALERAVELEDAPTPGDVATTLDHAHDATDEAADVVSHIRRPGLSKPLQVRTDEVRTNIERLRGRLRVVEEEIRAEND